MRILICDDDQTTAGQLAGYIRDFFKRDHLKCPDMDLFFDGESLLADPGEKDIVFLDVEMPGVDGIYVGQQLKKKQPDTIIFMVTSYTEYLDEAMRFHVFRYLSKPIDRKRLFRNLKDALKQYNCASEKVAIETRQGVFTVPVSDIICLETQGRKLVIHTLTRDFESVHNMQFWADTLPKNCFFQSHRSFIVNLSHVSEFDHSLIQLASHRFEAYLTRRKYTEFKAAYFLYLESTR